MDARRRLQHRAARPRRTATSFGIATTGVCGEPGGCRSACGSSAVAAARVARGRGHGGRAKSSSFPGRRRDARAAPVRLPGGPTLADAPGTRLASLRLPAAGAATAPRVPHESPRAAHVVAGHAARLRPAGEARHSQELDRRLVRQHLTVTRLQNQTGNA